MRGILKPTHFRDLGNLMLAFVMLWAYTNFSQFLLIWYGNIKEETPYYLMRMHGVWGVDGRRCSSSSTSSCRSSCC